MTALLFETRTMPGRPTAPGSPDRVVNSWPAAAGRQRAKERAELASLDDRMLADIGISRAEAQF